MKGETRTYSMEVVSNVLVSAVKGYVEVKRAQGCSEEFMDGLTELSWFVEMAVEAIVTGRPMVVELLEETAKAMTN